MNRERELELERRLARCRQLRREYPDGVTNENLRLSGDRTAIDRLSR